MMKLLTTRFLHLPLGMLVVGLVTPPAVTLLATEAEPFMVSLPYWMSCWIYLGLSLMAIRLTCLRLIESSVPTRNCTAEQTGVQAHVRTAELLIMGVALYSLNWGVAPTVIEEAVLFISMRLGITLLLLGGVVMMFTHIKMRDLQGAKK
ncbi:hypothetical protein [Cellvibrio mixtus]|uniref:hypothetical protein n=1 Tax=Cellvibrio mixtus TaxID=39650 RepID=UPI00058694AF|nr:hypothetical protein [Cellvibrio mixtus]